MTDSTEQRSGVERRRQKLYGRRKGPKLSAHQAELRRTLLSELAFDPAKDALSQFPDAVREVWLEVGFGAGEHLFQLASENPDIGLIGAEPYEMGVAKLLTKLANHPLNNVRIHEGDGRDIITALPDALSGHRLAGIAGETGNMPATLTAQGMNPLLVGAFKAAPKAA